uniref:Uncharacterized protein n=1 Tax=Onchocerca volvulus TaxID=6282 RepID=A0A8R1XUB0_ONCVO
MGPSTDAKVRKYEFCANSLCERQFEAHKIKIQLFFKAYSSIFCRMKSDHDLYTFRAESPTGFLFASRCFHRKNSIKIHHFTTISFIMKKNIPSVFTEKKFVKKEK